MPHRDKEYRQLALQIVNQLPSDYEGAKKTVTILDRLVEYIEHGLVVADGQGGVEHVDVIDATPKKPLQLVVNNTH